MRIILAQLTKFPEAGRVDIFEYACALAKLGHDVHAIVCEQVSHDLPKGLTVHELGISTNAGPSNSLRFASLALSEIRTIHKESPVDIIHLFNPSPATYALGWRLTLFTRRPKIVYDIRTGGIGKGLDSHLINFMAKTSPGFADGIITLSESLYARLFKKRHLNHAVVPLGVATDRYAAPARKPGTAFSFIYVGSLGKNRNLTTLIDAFAIVHANHPQASLSFVGGGDESEILKEQAGTKGLTDAVRFTATVPFEEIPALMAKADCGVSFIPITPWFNPQPPLKTIEYLASNLPVVGTATESHMELWGDMPKALLRLDTAEDFAKGMEYALQNRSELLKLKGATLAKRFDWTTITREKLVPYYQKLLNR